MSDDHEDPIASTQMFRAFVNRADAANAQASRSGSGTVRWIAGSVLLLILVAVLLWLLLR
ncbi:MAG TPA: hypothetical protein VLJ59_20575 [Mycobacteriales bacterium]|nr:hypothetical protein [Mycobacteriales bacterium]